MKFNFIVSDHHNIHPQQIYNQLLKRQQFLENVQNHEEIVLVLRQLRHHNTVQKHHRILLLLTIIVRVQQTILIQLERIRKEQTQLFCAIM